MEIQQDAFGYGYYPHHGYGYYYENDHESLPPHGYYYEQDQLEMDNYQIHHQNTAKNHHNPNSRQTESGHPSNRGLGLLISQRTTKNPPNFDPPKKDFIGVRGWTEDQIWKYNLKSVLNMKITFIL